MITEGDRSDIDKPSDRVKARNLIAAAAHRALMASYDLDIDLQILLNEIQRELDHALYLLNRSNE